MAYYSKVNNSKTRDQKRRQAETRGGFDDEGSNYSNTRPNGKRNTSPKGKSFQRASFSDNGVKRSNQRGGFSDDGAKRSNQRGGFSDNAAQRSNQRGGFSDEGTKHSNARPAGKRTGPSKGHSFQRGELRFAPKSNNPYRPRGEQITPKPYDVQRRERKEAFQGSDYGAPRPLQPVEEVVYENLLSGRNPIREALKSGRDIEKMMVARGELTGSAREILAMAKQQRVPIQEVDRSRLDAITPNHQGMLAFASAYQYHDVQEMLDLAADRNEKPFLVMLDGITDPHNLGAVIRTAECAGAHGVIVQERRAVGLTPAAVKASAGAIEHIMVSRVVNLASTLSMLKEKGIWAYAADASGEDYQSIDFSGGAVIVIGAEGDGVSRLVLESCDKTVSLPIKGKIDSLNASVAAGILLYTVLQSR